MVFLMMVLSYSLLLTISSYYYLWGLMNLFSLMTLLVIKMNGGRSSSVMLYFTNQEVWGLCFLVMFNLDYSNFYYIMFKGGFAPFHFWMSPVIRGLPWVGFSWMMTMAKLPYYLLLCMWGESQYLMLVLVGSLVPLLQAILENHSMVLLFLLMSSSGNNMLILSWFEPMFSAFVLGFYVILMYSFMVNMTVMGYVNVQYEMVYIMMAFPGSLPFYIKMFSMYLISNSGGVIFILVLIGFVLNMLSGYNLLIGINSSSRFSGKASLYLVLFLVVLLLI